MKLPPDLAAKALAAAGLAPAARPKRPAKYRNRRTVVDGVAFDSAKEAERWGHLRLLAAAGAIADLRRQVPFALVVNGVAVARYVADFVYAERGETIVEDVKSPVTRKLPAYRLKKKLMAALYGIDIREV